MQGRWRVGGHDGPRRSVPQTDLLAENCVDLRGRDKLEVSLHVRCIGRLEVKATIDRQPIVQIRNDLPGGSIPVHRVVDAKRSIIRLAQTGSAVNAESAWRTEQMTSKTGSGDTRERVNSGYCRLLNRGVGVAMGPSMPELFRTVGLWLLLSLTSFVLALMGACDTGASEVNIDAADNTRAAMPNEAAMRIVVGESTESVVGVNLQGLWRSSVGKELRSIWLEGALDDLSPFAVCQLKDPIASVLIGRGSGETVAVITTTVSRRDLVSCAKRTAKRFGKTIEPNEGALPFWRDGNEVSWVAFVDEHTVVTGSGAADSSWVTSISNRANAKVNANASLMKLLNKVDREATAWMVMSGEQIPLPSTLLTGAKGSVTEIYGSIDIAKGLELRGAARFSTEELATRLAEKAELLNEAMTGDANMKIAAVGNQLQVTIQLTEGVVAKRLKTLMPAVASAVEEKRQQQQGIDFEMPTIKMPAWSPPVIGEPLRSSGKTTE